MLPPAPGRLSMTTCCVKPSVIFCPNARAMVSFPPPGGNGTMKRIGFVGKACATAAHAHTHRAAAAITRIIRSPPLSPARRSTLRQRLQCATRIPAILSQGAVMISERKAMHAGEAVAEALREEGVEKVY